jgi:hypothetical protein
MQDIRDPTVSLTMYLEDETHIFTRMNPAISSIMSLNALISYIAITCLKIGSIPYRDFKLLFKRLKVKMSQRLIN